MGTYICMHSVFRQFEIDTPKDVLKLINMKAYTHKCHHLPNFSLCIDIYMNIFTQSRSLHEYMYIYMNIFTQCMDIHEYIDAMHGYTRNILTQSESFICVYIYMNDSLNNNKIHMI
jgi:hypothetical protein